MTTTASNQDLGERIEQLVQGHIAASRRAAQEALERAFASAACRPARAPTRCENKSRNEKRRTPEEIAALGERLYQAVCATPGERMVVLAANVGASVRELNRPLNLLKRAGRVRSVGARNFTRYFPMANGATASASASVD